jgi:hypothetical protein
VSPSASRNPPASVLSAMTAPSSNDSEFAAPISRAAGEASDAAGSAASLCGTVTLAPR